MRRETVQLVGKCVNQRTQLIPGKTCEISTRSKKLQNLLFTRLHTPAYGKQWSANGKFRPDSGNYSHAQWDLVYIL